MTYDGATWGAFACVLSALGAMITWQLFVRRGLAAGVRGLAWTIVPIAAWLTGTLRLAVEVLNDVGDWATRVVFSPGVWLGIILAGVAVVLFGASSLLRGREPATVEPAKQSRRKRRAAARAGSPAAVSAPASSGDDDMDEIAAILRKHGIS